MKIASSGRCNSSELSDGLIWSPVTCPSPYFWVCLLGLTLYLVTFSPGTYVHCRIGIYYVMFSSL